MLRGAIGDGPPDSLHDWTREGGHWRLAICHNGLDIFEELPNVDYVARSCGRAMKAVCVVEASCEAIFQLVMSMDTTRFKMETNMSLSRIHDRCLLILLLQLIILNEYLWFLWPRDLCYLRYWRRNDDGTYVVLFQSREHPNCGPQPGFVRAHIEKGGFQISPLNSRNGRSRTQVQHLMQIDLKGWSAGFLPSFRKDCLLHMLNYVAGLREFLSRSDGLQLI